MCNNSVRLPSRLSRACPPRLFASSLRVSASPLLLSSLYEADFHLKKESPPKKKWEEKKNGRVLIFLEMQLSPLTLSRCFLFPPSFLFSHIIMLSAAFTISFSCSCPLSFGFLFSRWCSDPDGRPTLWMAAKRDCHRLQLTQELMSHVQQRHLHTAHVDSFSFFSFLLLYTSIFLYVQPLQKLLFKIIFLYFSMLPIANLDLSLQSLETAHSSLPG